MFRKLRFLMIDNRKLEKSACECYNVIQQFEDDLGLR